MTLLETVKRRSMNSSKLPGFDNLCLCASVTGVPGIYCVTHQSISRHEQHH